MSRNGYDIVGWGRYESEWETAPNPKQVGRLMELMDANGDGDIDFGEFCLQMDPGRTYV